MASRRYGIWQGKGRKHLSGLLYAFRLSGGCAFDGNGMGTCRLVQRFNGAAESAVSVLLQREVLDGVRQTNWSAWSCLEGEKMGEKTRKKACADTEKRLRFKMR